MVADRDDFFMRQALQLAERGRGHTSPNPMVGALVVDRDGVIVGRGAHAFAGGPHAEVHALADAGARAAGATLYCTLEPCSHTGRTGPCAPLVAAAGIARVVIATHDPNPLVAGRGVAFLRERGLEVRAGVQAADAARLNAPFFTAMTKGRPFVTLKIALSQDGRIAANPGARTPLTGLAANRQVQRDRAEVDGIAVGVETVACDDPLLTARGAYRARPLTRVIFDRRLRTAPSARIFTTLAAGPVIIMTSLTAATVDAERAAALRGAGAEIEPVGEESVAPALRALLARGVTSLIVEGGARLHRAFWDAGVVDRVQMYVTPRVLGAAGVTWLPPSLLSAPALGERTVRILGDDLLIEAYVHRTD